MFAAAVIAAPGAAVEVREYPEPPLEPDSALLAVELSKVCGTDVHLRDGRLAGVPYPLIPGHVSVGVLVKVRGRLRDVDGNALRRARGASDGALQRRSCGARYVEGVVVTR